MHHCLRIPELNNIIIKNVKRDRDLAALAATCKAFRDPALQSLWEDPGTLAPLIRCLPRDIWYEELEERAFRDWPTRRLILKRSPDCTTDWTQFKFYAPFIRHLGCRWEDEDTTEISLVDISILSALASSDLEKPILPGLKSLLWTDPQLQIDTFIFAQFFGPRLTRLSIGIAKLTYTPAAWDVWMHSLRNLRIFTLWVLDDLARQLNLTQPISDLVCLLRDIEEVHTNILLNHEAVRHLAASSCSKVSLANKTTDLLQSLTGSVPLPFHNLNILGLNSYNLTQVARFLELLRADTLCWMKIHYDSEHPLDAVSGLAQLFQTIATVYSPTEPLSIEIESLTLSLLNPQTPAQCSFATLAPLLTLRNLVVVEICEEFCFDLDDEDIEKIAIAWPCLRAIALMTVGIGGSSVTLEGLVTLSKLCPELTFLSLAISIAGVDFGLLPLEPNVTSDEADLTIDMQHSSVGALVDPRDVAAFLFSLFPSLVEIEGHYRRPGGLRQDFWEQVRERFEELFQELPPSSRDPSPDGTDG